MKRGQGDGSARFGSGLSRAASKPIAESIEVSASEPVFDKKRQAVLGSIRLRSLNADRLRQV
jgi:hypothetical protein